MLGGLWRVCGRALSPQSPSVASLRCAASWKYWRDEAPKELRAVLPTAASLVARTPGFVQPYLQLMRLDKPIGTWLLFLPCSWSIALASAPALPSPHLLALFGGGALLMRASGCIINDLWDQDLDRRVERTKSRPLPSGALSQLQALVLLSTTLLSSAAILFQLNWLSIFVGLSSMGLVATYPLAKRYTNWPQFVLGLTINWGAILGWTAVTNSVSVAPILSLYSAGIAWSLIYDTIYAHQDRVDDAVVGMGSSALVLGERWTKPVLGVFAASFLGSLYAAGLSAHLGQLYAPVLTIAGIRLASIIWRVELNSPASCWSAFVANRNVGFIVLVAILLGALSKTDSESSPILVLPQAPAP